ncbi:TFIIA-alpha and beta-like factor [Pimephales promelas]|nr:TFIIA-alpha and beta-like factor [Pimephales promelas]
MDPLNSGDDVSDQDIPEVFDTENVIVCQYDKIHRSKNRWKFYLKDGVMCYGGKDYVFSKAVGEAECDLLSIIIPLGSIHAL